MAPPGARRTEDRPLANDSSGRGGSRPPGPGPGSTSPRSQLELAADEDVLFELRGIGAWMVGTTQRVVVTRDGSERRPRSGMQTFPIDTVSHVRLELGTRPSGRIALWVEGREAVSMFFDARSIDLAYTAVDRLRPVLARNRKAAAELRHGGSAELRHGGSAERPSNAPPWRKRGPSGR